MRFTYRLTVAALLVAAMLLAMWITQLGASPAQVPLPEPDLRSLPMQLGQWSGEKTAPRSGLVGRGEVEYTVNRNYQSKEGKSVDLHIAVITNYGEKRLSHFPKYCYKAFGYEVREMRRRPLKLPDDQQMPVTYFGAVRNEELAAMAYWYQFGDELFFNIGEFRTARRKRWGTSEWPPVIKVLLHTSTDNPDQTPPHLEEFAGLVAGWTRPSKASQDRPPNPSTRP